MEEHISEENAKALYNLAMKTWGEPAQILMLIEECTELSTVLCHMLRGREPDDIALIDELADVSIMVDQVSALVSPTLLKDTRQAKLRRLKQRLEKHVGPIRF